MKEKKDFRFQISDFKDRTLVSIVIPVYNEEAALPYLSNTLRSLENRLNQKGYSVEFIFVDDKSKDNTFEKLHELFRERENVKILQHEKNQGVAAGIMTGIKAAETEIVCSMDCDCTYDPHELAKMIPLLTEKTESCNRFAVSRKRRRAKCPRMAFVFVKRCVNALSDGFKIKT